MTATLPLFYFKPTICWVDDDQIFLDAVNASLQQHCNCITFNDPNEAIKYFARYQSPLAKITFKREFTESDIFGVNDHYPVDINIPIIKDISEIADKAREIAILVIDYNMPETNGVELCKQLKSLPIKKILLTGEASHEKAIEAFNLGLIDKFIKKDHNITDKLRGYIDELIYQYFYEKTSDLISHIEASKLSLLSDHNFIKFFNKWCLENNIEEFYLVNKNGSFLLKNKNGESFHFVIMSDLDKNEFIKLNDEMFDKVGALLNQVAEDKIIPFFGVGTESWDIDTAEWQHYFYPSQIISGRENYHWAVVKAAC